LKIDVEGAETKVLKGARNMLNCGKSIYILTEDSFDQELERYVEGLGAVPIGKFTCENSWWHLPPNSKKVPGTKFA